MAGNPEINLLRNVKLSTSVELTKHKAPNREHENPRGYLGEREVRLRWSNLGNALH
jgi:hypothetical protein